MTADTTPGGDLPSATLLKAIGLSLLGITLLDSMGAVIKHLGDAYPPQQMSVYRNLFGLIPSLILLLASRDWHARGRILRIERWGVAIVRGLFVAGAQVCFYLALVHLEFATAVTLAFAGPMFVTALSVPILGDRVGPYRWTAVLVGFAGIVWVVRPGSDLFSLYALLPLGAAFGYAMSTVLVRLIGNDSPSALIHLYGTATTLAAALVMTLATGGFVPVAGPGHWTWIVVMGLLGGTGVLCLVVAYRMTRPSNLAPFDYFGIVYAFLVGWLVFGEAPYDRLFPGTLLIVAGGLLILWRERRQKTQAAAS